MKRLLFSSVIFILLFSSLWAQNVQLHYDLGETRKMFTTTVEMFKPDKLGSTFFFIDMDYGSKASEVDGINLAYWEIARSMKILKDNPFEIRAEYNGGFGRGQFMISDEVNTYSYSINSAWLAGVQYTWNSDDFSKVFTLQGNYKYIKDKANASFQVTAVWALHFFERKLSLMGFADFWMEENSFQQSDGSMKTTDFVFLAEPQFWYNINPHFSVGGEIEVSSNFGGNEGFMINPTVAGKWTF